MVDGQEVDWEAEVHRTPDLGRTLDGLHRIQRIADAFRAAGAAGGPTDPGPPLFTWGPFRVLEKLGDGSFGEVYRAFEPRLERDVALKLRRVASEETEVGPAGEPLPAGVSGTGADAGTRFTVTIPRTAGSRRSAATRSRAPSSCPDRSRGGSARRTARDLDRSGARIQPRGAAGPRGPAGSRRRRPSSAWIFAARSPPCMPPA